MKRIQEVEHISYKGNNIKQAESTRVIGTLTPVASVSLPIKSLHDADLMHTTLTPLLKLHEQSNQNPCMQISNTEGQ